VWSMYSKNVPAREGRWILYWEKPKARDLLERYLDKDLRRLMTGPCGIWCGSRSMRRRTTRRHRFYGGASSFAFPCFGPMTSVSRPNERPLKGAYARAGDSRTQSYTFRVGVGVPHTARADVEPQVGAIVRAPR